MVPLLGLISAWMRRNRTYTNAEEFMDDMNDEYTQRLATLDRQHQEGTVFMNPNPTLEEQEAASRTKPHSNRNR